MELDQKDAIAAYKKAAAKLGQGTLSDFMLPDFRDTAVGESGRYDQITEYLRIAKPYEKMLVDAANKRQYHYERFLRVEQLEDAGHRHWREGLNLIATDAQEKVTRWDAACEESFMKLVSATPVRLQLPPELELAEVPFEESTNAASSVERPILRAAEKKRRKRLRRRARDKKDKSEQLLLQRLVSIYCPSDKAISLNTTFTLKHVSNLVDQVVLDPYEFSIENAINLLVLFEPQITITASSIELALLAHKLLSCPVHAPSANLLAAILCKSKEFRQVCYARCNRADPLSDRGGPILCCNPQIDNKELARAIARGHICFMVHGICLCYLCYLMPRDWKITMYLKRRLEQIQVAPEATLRASQSVKVSTPDRRSYDRTLELYPQLYKAMLRYTQHNDIDFPGPLEIILQYTTSTTARTKTVRGRILRESMSTSSLQAYEQVLDQSGDHGVAMAAASQAGQKIKTPQSYRVARRNRRVDQATITVTPRGSWCRFDSVELPAGRHNRLTKLPVKRDHSIEKYLDEMTSRRKLGLLSKGEIAVLEKLERTVQERSAE